MTKLELIQVLERNLKILKNPNIPEEVNVFHTLDTGGYTGDCSEIYDFDLVFSWDEEEEILFLEYCGDENPGTI